MEEKILIFEMFCHHAGILVLNKKTIPRGIQFDVAASHLKARMTIYADSSTLAEGNDDSLRSILYLWEGREANHRAHSGMPGLNMSWKEWKEDKFALLDYHSKHGIPNEVHADDDYKSTRERLFHDYMFRKASNHKMINVHAVEFVIRSWLKHYCFMNIDVDTLIRDLRKQALSNYSSYVKGDLIPFDIVVDELTYVITVHCCWKMIGEGSNCTCVMQKDHSDCIVRLIDAMYVYCENQSVICYNKTNLKRLLSGNEDELSWNKLKFDSPIEQAMDIALKESGLVSIPQFQACAPAHHYRVDFLIKTDNMPIAIECDGLEFHANKNTYITDRQRDRILQSNGFYVMRFSSVEIYNNLNGCIEEINEAFWNIQKGKIYFGSNRPLGYFGSL